MAAWLYAASEVTAKVGQEGAEVSIDSETEYPFNPFIKMEVKSLNPVAFPLYLRVPCWCPGFRVTVNGQPLDVEAEPATYVRIERIWSAGDTIIIDMPMEVSLTQWPRNGSVTVDRGPLSYSLKIKERWHCWGGTDEWPEWEVFPTTPWNYGLVIDRDNPLRSLEVVEKGIVADQPWTIEAAPVEIKARGKRISNWMLENETVAELQQSPVSSDQPEKQITLIPMGCARLRMSCLPTIGEGPDAWNWEKACRQ